MPERSLEEQPSASPSASNAAGSWLDIAAIGNVERRSRAMSERLGLSIVDTLKDHPVAAEFIEKIPIAFARRFNLLGLAGGDDRLRLAVCDLINWEPMQMVSRLVGKSVAPVLASATAIGAAINNAYQQRTGQTQNFLEKIERSDVLAEVSQLQAREDLLDVASRAPVIKLVNLILFEAIQARASDVHVQPYEQTLVVRLRIDGVLYDSFDLPKNLQEEVVGRIKVMGHMNIAEKRLPQDGRATVQAGDRAIDLRIATLPTTFGERAVIRLLDKGERLYAAAEIGMEAQTLERFRRLIQNEHGIILVTGPTGSGKTTTLYAGLREIDGTQRNILTLEDPVEYRLPGISQTQISDKKGMTFASGLRSVLRQDPDIIMVGEIRDRETAVMAIQSALTGHLVFSTLHTNDAASAIARLLDLGTEPYLLASSIIGVLAQRLVRRICPDCKAPKAIGQVAAIGASSGCPTCRGTGYRGRVGVFELLQVDEAVRRQITARASAPEIKAAAVAGGMLTLRDDGMAKQSRGVTTMEEVLRVTMNDDS
ncbi:MAG TPA: ATPase, T2SS/T4P/T4SS family [Tepidisphaeraceae bacterium]|jgi:general secretion pathway protein E|nr:ATPase, T2SS/T4P/T4SS family [Tepidisphaeraceae bacterium]